MGATVGGGLVDESERDQLLLGLLAEVKALRAPGAGPDCTFGSLWATYAEEMKRRAWFVHSASMFKPVVSRFAGRKVSTLTKADWHEWIAFHRTQQTRDRKPPSIGTMNAELVRAKAMLNWGVEHEHIATNPWREIKRLPGQRARRTEIDAGELDKAIASGGAVACTFLMVYFEAGMRASEIRHMEWGEVDFRRMRITVPAERTKTHEPRTVPMSEILSEWLRRMPRHLKSPKVFANPKTGDAYTKQYLWVLTRPILDKLKAAPGDGNVHCHDARHSLVSRLARAGMNVFSAMKIAGHRSAFMHWRYHHLNDTDQARAKELLDGERRGPVGIIPGSATEQKNESSK